MKAAELRALNDRCETFLREAKERAEVLPGFAAKVSLHQIHKAEADIRLLKIQLAGMAPDQS